MIFHLNLFAIDSPQLTNCSLSSLVYYCFSIFIIISLQKLTLILWHSWKMIFRGKLNWAVIGVSTLVSIFSLSAQTAMSAENLDTISEDKLLEMPLESLIEIVTGTRDVGVMVWQSTSPIQVVSAKDLAATGQNNVFDALMKLVPSMSWTSNYDLGNIVRSVRLRGMSPGEVLVLIDGKRRHTTARVNSTPGADQGSNPVDLDLIPLSMIDHVEILLDGASAQYGSDAVSGVINFILKKPIDHGTTVTIGTGLTSRGDGRQENVGVSQGFKLDSEGALNVSVDYRYQDFAHRTANFFGSDVPNYSLDYPQTNQVTGGFNLDKPFNHDIDIYAFGTIASRNGETTENVRVTSPFDSTVPSSQIYPTNATSIFPTFFVPRETLGEIDDALTVGIKGRDLADWNWDLSITYGSDSQDEGVINDVNVGLLTVTGHSPTSFYVGNETASQITTNLDLRRPFQTSILPAPVNVAVGLEYRSETYSEGAGDAASYLYGGSSAFSGKSPADASQSSRNVAAAYVDLSTNVVPKWVVGVAGRIESYDESGIGSTANGKLTTRYDLTPHWAVRATISSGFHAPTLGQSHFSDTVVNPPTSGSPTVSAQLPVASAGGALLGEASLQPEKSNNFDFGLVAEPLSGLNMTLDAYQIDLTNRIIDTGFIPGPSAAASANALILAALAANGNSIAPGSQVAVQFFTNGVDTRTRGLDLTANYTENIDQFGQIKWLLGGNYNQTTITKVHTPPATLANAGISYVNPEVANDLTDATPKSRVILGANYRQGRWDFTLRETRYSSATDVSSFFVVPYSTIVIPPAYIADVDIGYYLTEKVKLSFGGNNVFNKLPPPPVAATLDAVDRYGNSYPINTPWGYLGAFYYINLHASF